MIKRTDTRDNTDPALGQFVTARFVLAMIVVIAHVGQIFIASTVPSSVMAASAGIAAWWAVVAFFAISGYFIAYALTHRNDDPDRMFLAFMLRRFARIYPPLLAAFAVTCALGVVLTVMGKADYVGDAPNPARTTYLFSIAYAWKALVTFGLAEGLSATNGPLWSLTLELRLYLVAGLAGQVLLAKSSVVRICALVVLGVVLHIVVTRYQAVHAAFYLAFFAGVATNLTVPQRLIPQVLPVMRADYSYSLYILHFPILLFGFFVAGPGVLAAVVSFAAAVLAAYVCGNTLETPRVRAFIVSAGTTAGHFVVSRVKRRLTFGARPRPYESRLK